MVDSNRCPKRILFITLSNIGDVVLTTPALSALRRMFPAAEISVLSGPRPAELFRAHPWLTHVFVYDKNAKLVEKIRLINKLRLLRFNAAVDLRHSLIPWLIGAKPLGKSLLSKPALNGPRVHAVDEHMSVLEEYAPVELEEKTTFPFFGADEEKKAAELLLTWGLQRNTPFVLMGHGGRSHLKRWPPARFREIALELYRRTGMPTVLVGDGSDCAMGREIASGAETCVKDLSGETSLQTLAALIRLSTLVVTNDSSVLHLADQQGLPVVAIFGPTSEERYGPRGKKSRVVRKALFCSPCGLAQCPYGHECMLELSYEPVLEACLELLSRCGVAV